MGWRGAGGNGAANVGVYFGFGGILMILGSVGEVRDRHQPLATFPCALLTSSSG